MAKCWSVGGLPRVFGFALAFSVCGLLLFDQTDNVGHLPQFVRNARGHRGSNLQGTVNLDEVVVHEVERNGGNVMLHTFTKGIREPGESAHVHPHREVLAFNVASADVLLIRGSGDVLTLAANTLSGAVSFF